MRDIELRGTSSATHFKNYRRVPISKEEPMTSPKDTTPPTGARLPTPAERPTWLELVNQERRLLDGLVELWRTKSRHPPAEVDKIVARALAEALQEIIAKE